MSDGAVHRDRRRAESFGAAADRYDRHRPRYPAELIAELVPQAGISALDVGAGTGIASRQLTDAGAEVLAVEPDSQMARIATAKGLSVEVATFERWVPANRTFDLVVFAQSFHWVEPEQALAKVAALLEPGGRLALLWNRIAPTAPTREHLAEAYAGLLDQWQRPSLELEESSELTELLDEAGYTGVRHRYEERLHYSTEDWVDMVATYSNVLTLSPADQVELRTRLARSIGETGVDAVNDALAVVCELR